MAKLQRISMTYSAWHTESLRRQKLPNCFWLVGYPNNFCCFFVQQVNNALHCWFGVKLLMFQVARPILVFLSLVIEILCALCWKCFRANDYSSSLAAEFSEITQFSGIYVISCHSRSNILVSIDRGLHHFLTQSLAVNPNAKFCAAWSNRCADMAVFNFSRWRPSAILDFEKLEILTARTLRGAKMRHRAKFCADRSRRYGRF